MRDPLALVDLAGLAAAGDRPGALWRLDGEDLQANLIRLGLGDRIQPHRNDQVEVHPLAPMALVHTCEAEYAPGARWVA